MTYCRDRYGNFTKELHLTKDIIHLPSFVYFYFGKANALYQNVSGHCKTTAKRAYLLIAYPELANDDFDKIQNYRKHKDELYFSVVKPHFTIVFPVFDIKEDEFIKEVKTQTSNLNGFDFTIRCATISKDTFSEYFHAFLVPDEGFSSIIKIHDKLYSDRLKDNLRLDIDFVPHIGIGNSTNKLLCKKMVDDWNKEEFEIAGTIKQLTVVKYENNTITEIENIELN